jgi:transcriptional regulator with XRE-family HTH domain
MAKKLNRIAEILKEKEITQYRLHKESGVGYSLINSYFKNTRQPSLETIFKLAKALKVNPKELINS